MSENAYQLGASYDFKPSILGSLIANPPATSVTPRALGEGHRGLGQPHESGLGASAPPAVFSKSKATLIITDYQRGNTCANFQQLTSSWKPTRSREVPVNGHSGLCLLGHFAFLVHGHCSGDMTRDSGPFALVVPWLLRPMNLLWSRIGGTLHVIVPPVVMGAVFFLAVTPLAMIIKLWGKDPLHLKSESSSASHWIERDPPGPHPRTLTLQF
jgi:hypothetical protein